jgi:hypothetical protein
MAQYDLSEEEVGALITAIHLAEDILVETCNDLSTKSNPEDQETGRGYEKVLDLLNTARKKLGDTWEPAPEYKVPDSPKDLT